MHTNTIKYYLCLPLLLISLVFNMSLALADELKVYQGLRDNGIISQAEFDRLSKTIEEENGKTKGEIRVKVGNRGKLKIKSATGDFQYQVGGRIQTDFAVYDADTKEFTDGTEFRRTRLFVKGRMYKKWLWKAQFDFSSNETEIKDMYMGYEFDPMLLRIGQFGESGSLEDSTSSKYITFMERSLPVLAFTPAERRVGIALSSFHEYGSYSFGIFEDAESADETESSKGASARTSYVPWHSKTEALHLGASIQYRTPPEDAVRFRARPEAHVDDQRLVSTDKIMNTNHYSINGLEAAWVNGAVSIQGEYINAKLTRKAKPNDLTFDGYYVYGSWFVTGESRRYEIEDGTFGRVRPMQNVTDGGIGAWELALRFSHLNLNDHEIRGGKEDNITLGLNWYLNPNIRFMFNYVRVESETNSGDVDPFILQIRAQIDF